MFLAIIGLLAILASCAEKLPAPTSPVVADTITVHDTIHDTTAIHDTTEVHDTTTVHDTIYDTTVIIDTILVDSCTLKPSCGTLDCKTKQIKWFIPLQPGQYTFDFFGTTEKDKPEQQLTVQIGALTYDWPIGTQKELSLDYTTSSSGIWVVITSDPPPARGHEIQICLQIRKE
ncbi:MAG: hypothetical protein HZC01_00625 [Candidatus Kerfeldbacteria bacterium]|nr:hypothetical protein [Candidatus Kerfeldbacteria bacterium]